MLKYLALACASLLIALAGVMPAQAGGASRASNAVYLTGSDAFFQRVASKPCCYNDGEYFNSSPSTCNKYGGRVVSYDYCQRQYYNQNNDYPSYGGKPCCFNNGQYFNATPRTCRHYGGRVASQDRCDRYYSQQWGDDGYNNNNNNGYGNGYGNGNAPNAEKPCCRNNGRYYNSTPKTCTKYGGRVVDQRYCTGGY